MVVETLNYFYTNWAETFEARPISYFEPINTKELKEIFAKARKAKKHVTFVGNGRSPSDLPCNKDYMVSMKMFNKILEINHEKKYVHAEGGVILGDLQEALNKADLALPSLPSINHVTLAGAVSVGTHGTGADSVTLSDSIIEIVLCKANGEVVLLKAESDDTKFKAACCSLGYLGAIISLKIKVEPAFRLLELKKPSSLPETLKNYKTLLKTHDKYRFMYYPHTGMCVNYLIDKTTEPIRTHSSYFWDTIVAYYLFQIALLLCYFFPSLLPAVNSIFFYLLHNYETKRVDQSDKVMNFDVLFKQYVTEYAFPIDKLPEVFAEFEKGIAERNLKVHCPVEVRFVKKDNVLLSQSHGQDVAHINLVSFKPFGKKCPKADAWELFEEIMLKVGGRPHWAKLHKCGRNRIKALYGNAFKAFMKVKHELDPDGLFCNDYYRRHFTEEADLNTITYNP